MTRAEWGMGVSEICSQFGVGRATIYNIIRDGYIKTYRSGVAYRFKRKDVVVFFDRFITAWNDMQKNGIAKEFGLYILPAADFDGAYNFSAAVIRKVCRHSGISPVCGGVKCGRQKKGVRRS